MVETHPYEAWSLAELSAGLAAGRWTSAELVDAYLARIDQLDGVFGAIRCVVPDAAGQAAASDERRSRGAVVGPLDGLPVVVKDNIDVAGVPTTGGALALERSMPERDAPLVARLREAGAVIMAKANLSEMANFLTDEMPSGYSSLGGQVLNPYDTSVTPSGSSSGSAAAVALGMAPVAVGTETDGSINSPCEHQSLVGVKPTLGLVSRTGILPIAPSQDTAGSMARSVADAGLLLAVMAGGDPEDPATAGADSAAASLRDGTLDPGALAGACLAVVTKYGENDEWHRQGCHDEALEALRAAGAELVEVTPPKDVREDEMAVLHFEFGPAVGAYLARLGRGAPFGSLAEFRDWNLAHADEALKFGQTHVDAAVAIDHEAGRDAYLEARARDRARAISAFEEMLGDRAEALVFPGIEGGSWAARAGWPSIVVPAGYSAANRRPAGLMFVSRPWTELRLLSLALGFEQAHPARRSPFHVNPAAFRNLGR